jgi:hypothetical protein
LAGDVVAGGAERATETDLGSSFDDVEEGGVGDGDRADEQGEAGEGIEQGLNVIFDLVAERVGVRRDERLKAVRLLGSQCEWCLGTDELGGSGGGVDEDLAFGVGGGELGVGRGGGDGDGEEEVGVAGDVFDDAGDEIGVSSRNTTGWWSMLVMPSWFAATRPMTATCSARCWCQSS